MEAAGNRKKNGDSLANLVGDQVSEEGDCNCTQEDCQANLQMHSMIGMRQMRQVLRQTIALYVANNCKPCRGHSARAKCMLASISKTTVSSVHRTLVVFRH